MNCRCCGRLLQSWPAWAEWLMWLCRTGRCESRTNGERCPCERHALLSPRLSRGGRGRPGRGWPWGGGLGRRQPPPHRRRWLMSARPEGWGSGVSGQRVQLGVVPTIRTRRATTCGAYRPMSRTALPTFTAVIGEGRREWSRKLAPLHAVSNVLELVRDIGDLITSSALNLGGRRADLLSSTRLGRGRTGRSFPTARSARTVRPSSIAGYAVAITGTPLVRERRPLTSQRTPLSVPIRSP